MGGRRGRAPFEQGGACLKCCDDATEGCAYHEWSCGRDTQSPWCQGEPWYNSNGLYEGKRCSEIKESTTTDKHGSIKTVLGCGPPCALCDARTEADLKKLIAPPDCSCTEASLTSVDPCFSPDSCDCYCQLRAKGLRACPDAEL